MTKTTGTAGEGAAHEISERTLDVARWVIIAIAVTILAGASVLSYVVLSDVAGRTHLSTALAGLWAGLVIASIVQALLSLVVLSHRGSTFELAYFSVLAALALGVALAGSTAYVQLPEGAAVTGAGAAGIANVPPVAVLVCTHAAIIMLRHRGIADEPVLRVTCWVSVALAVFIVVSAFVLSFVALNDAAARAHLPAALSWIWPLIVDATTVQATLALVVLARRGSVVERSYFSVVAVLSVLVSLAGNTAHALLAPGAAIGGAAANVIAAVGPLAVLLSTYAAVVIVRHRRPVMVAAVDDTNHVDDTDDVEAVSDAQMPARDNDVVGESSAVAERVVDAAAHVETMQAQEQTHAHEPEWGVDDQSAQPVVVEDGEQLDVDETTGNIPTSRVVVSEDGVEPMLLDVVDAPASQVQDASGHEGAGSQALTTVGAALDASRSSRSRLDPQAEEQARWFLTHHGHDMSLRQIAREVGVHHGTVSRVRDRMEAERLSNVSGGRDDGLVIAASVSSAPTGQAREEVQA